jgi:hypothetical protein
MPADIGLGNRSNSALVEQALAFSPANFLKPSGMSELPSSGYGAGARARLDDSILKNFEISQNQVPTGPMPVESRTAATATATAAASGENKTLRSILPASVFSARPTDITTQASQPNLIDALSRPAFEAKAPAAVAAYRFEPQAPAAAPVQAKAIEATAPSPVPANAFALNTSLYAYSADRAAQTFATAAVFKPTNISPLARTETGPLPVARPEIPATPAPTTVARVEAPVAPTAAKFDPASHPLLANINKEAKSSAYNFNARMDSTSSIEAMSRQLMAVDFGTPKAWANADKTSAKADPFAAPNCYQTMEFQTDGSVKTITTLPDLSASRIETVQLDRSKTVALTDHLGRAVVEQRVDATGQLVAHTTTRYDHEDAPLSPSEKVVMTATQTIKTKSNKMGTVVASEIRPYSDLNDTKSIG